MRLWDRPLEGRFGRINNSNPESPEILLERLVPIAAPWLESELIVEFNSDSHHIPLLMSSAALREEALPF